MAYLKVKCLVFTGSLGHAVDLAKLEVKKELNAYISTKDDKQFLRIRLCIKRTKIHLHLFADGVYILTGPKTESEALEIMTQVAPMLVQ